MFTNNTFAHDDFMAKIHDCGFTQEKPSPFALREGERIIPIRSERNKPTSFNEAEFLLEAGVIDDDCVEILKCIAELVICTPNQIEQHWKMRNSFSDGNIPKRDIIVRKIRKMINYGFIKAIRLECDECGCQSPYIVSMNANGQRALSAIGVRSKVISFFETTIEVPQIKNSLAVTQLLQRAFPAEMPFTKTRVLVSDAQSNRGIRPGALVDNSFILESVRRNENSIPRLMTKLQHLSNMLRLPEGGVNITWKQEPTLLIVTEDVEQILEVEAALHEELVMPCRVLITCDGMLYNYGAETPFLEVAVKKPSRMGFLRRMLQRVS